jgi:hypothetical protein
MSFTEKLKNNIIYKLIVENFLKENYNWKEM